jgi:hypothetical protein
MDRLKDRLAALAEEVGELAQPPGAAVTVWQARRRRRRVVARVAGVGLFSAAVVGLLLNPLGPGLLDPDMPKPWPASSSATPNSPGPLGQLTVSSVGHVVAPGEPMAILGEGCLPVAPGTVSLPRMGIRKLVPINGDGSFAIRVVVPRSTQPGAYDIVLRCHVTRDSLGRATDPVVIKPVRERPGTSP